MAASSDSREAFVAERYGLADLFFVANVDEATLRARREGDKTRARRNFDVNVRLRDSTLRWYEFIDSLDSGRLVFGLTDDGIAPGLLARSTRRVRSGAALFDTLMARLES